MRLINEIVSFLLEIVMLVSVSMMLNQKIDNKTFGVMTVVIVNAVIIALWVMFFAPRAQYRLSYPSGLILSSFLLFLAPVSFWLDKHKTFAILSALILLINRLLVVIWKQW
jgi:hypothetical protein